jgi:YD repeat-containing protein
VLLETYTTPATSNRLTNVKQGATTTRAFTYNARGDVTRDTRGATQYNYTINSEERFAKRTKRSSESFRAMNARSHAKGVWLGDTPLAVFEGANLYCVHPLALRMAQGVRRSKQPTGLFCRALPVAPHSRPAGDDDQRRQHQHRMAGEV